MKVGRLFLAGLIVLGFAAGVQAVDPEELEKTVNELQNHLMRVEGELQELKGSQDRTSNLLTQQTNVGGDIKFFLFDTSDGRRNRNSRSRSHPSAGLSGAILYVSRNLTDTVSVDIQPEISARASATPRLGPGEKITRTRSAGSFDVDILRAHLTWLMPGGFQLKAGAIKPLFTWDYGYELFWHEQYHGNYATTNYWLGGWGTDAGVELYKNVDFESWSLPMYLYVLNGLDSSNPPVADNNRTYSVLGHVQPEFLDGRLKLLGSLAWGKWDDQSRHDYIRYAVGAMAQLGDVQLRSEFMGGHWENRTAAEEADVDPWGLYMKALWTFHPKFRARAEYAHVHHDFVGGPGLFPAGSRGKDTYDQFTTGLNYFLTDSTTVMLDYALLNARRKGTSIRLDNVHRVTLGFRTTF